MTRRRILQVCAGLVALVAIAWLVSLGLQRIVEPAAPGSTVAPDPDTPPAATAHITATLFYGTANGDALVALRREVPLAEDLVSQGRAILAAQLEPAPAPHVSVIPPGTTLRAFYVTDRGDAFVDLSAELSRAHPGGSMTELLTVYAIVNAVTANLPAVERVQILVEGMEVETIAGHVDVRRPLTQDLSRVRED